MQSEFYKNYIKSEAWKEKCRQRIEIDNHRCVMCGRLERNCKNGLQVHHINYSRLGRENVYTDLISLCGGDHIRIHRYYNRVREPNSQND